MVPASDAGTTVYIHEASTYQRDGHVLQAGASALPEATQVVRDFLQAMGQRDLAAAAQCVAPGFEMVFPGHRRMRELAELGTWAATRYRDVQKDYERFDESWQGSHTVVFCSGTLFGHWPDGRAFAGGAFHRPFRGRRRKKSASRKSGTTWASTADAAAPALPGQRWRAAATSRPSSITAMA